MDRDLTYLSDEALETLEIGLHEYRRARQARQEALRALEREKLALQRRRAVLEALRALQEAIRLARADGIELSLPDIGPAQAVLADEPPPPLEVAPDDQLVTYETAVPATGVRLEYQPGLALNGGGLLGDRGEWAVMNAADGGWLPEKGGQLRAVVLTLAEAETQTVALIGRPDPETVAKLNGNGVLRCEIVCPGLILNLATAGLRLAVQVIEASVSESGDFDRLVLSVVADELTPPPAQPDIVPPPAVPARPLGMFELAEDDEPQTAAPEIVEQPVVASLPLPPAEQPVIAPPSPLPADDAETQPQAVTTVPTTIQVDLSAVSEEI